MFCPFCQAQDTKVIDSRLVGDGSQIRRRRECEVCHARFTTFETADLALPRIVKSDGSIGKYVNGSLAKKELLINEGLTIKDNKIIDFEQKLYKFEK